MQDRPEKKVPRTLRLNARDNIIVAVDSVQPGDTVQGVAAAARIMRGHKMAAEPIAKGQPVLKFGQIIGFATERHRARHPRAHAQLLVRRVRARLRLRPGRARGDPAAARGARHLRRLPPRQRQGGHAQLHRHPHQRELLGLGGPLHGRGGRRAPASWPITPTSTASSSFVHGTGCGLAGSGRGLRGAGAHAMGLRRPSQPRRGGGGGPGLRGVPDRAPEEQATA